MLSLNRFMPDAVDEQKIAAKFDSITANCKAPIKASCCCDRKLSKMERKAANMVLKRTTSGMPFSLAKVPYRERISRPEKAGLGSIINWMDGQKNLYEILRFIEFEYGRKYNDNEIGELIDYFKYLEKYGYIKIFPKYRLIKADIKKALRKLGIKKGDKIMFHSSLSSLGEVVGGTETVCRACMELVGMEGVLMMPSFNHYQAVGKEGKGFFDPLKTPTTNGAIPDFFWKMKDVFRSLDPSHAFAVWGKDAVDYVKGHHKVPTMGYGSPLELLERGGGKVVLVDCPDANTFVHVVEMTNDVPCLGQRTEEYNVKLPNGKMAKHRTWGWRDGICRVIKVQKHYELMRREKLIKEGTIGGAQVMVFAMKDFRKIYERLLKGKIRGVEGCADCPVRPRQVAATVRPKTF
ncbi:MAG: AAC(3) family N-acetyltransferase [Victivallales bacterium]|nr:AAC(3) family N-acetyltransferase [Victivallales bacterium]